MRRELWPIVIIGMLLLGARLMPLPQNGTLAGLPSICPFKNLFGLPCPGCGMTRALVYSAHGEWRQAFQFHPFGPLLFSGMCLVLLAGIVSLRYPLAAPSPRLTYFLLAAMTVAALVLWGVRLAGIFPYPAQI